MHLQIELLAVVLSLASPSWGIKPPIRIESKAPIPALAPNTTDVDVHPFRLHSYNIRWAAPGDGRHESNWTIRGPLVISQLQASAAGAVSLGAIPMIGLQEALPSQLEDIKGGLSKADGKPWASIGIGRDDGVDGEMVPLIYRSDQLRLLDQTCKWLSETPEVPSIGWNGGYKRTVAIGVFEVIDVDEEREALEKGSADPDVPTTEDEDVLSIGKTKKHAHDRSDGTVKRFIAANTHLDNISRQARVEGIRQVMRMLTEIQAAWGWKLPVFVMGDFNSAAGTDAHEVVRQSKMLSDSRKLAGEARRHGPDGTYLGFDPHDERKEQRIDYVLLGPADGWVGAKAKNKWEVTSYQVLDHVVNGTWASDHRSLMVDADLTFDDETRG